MSPGVFRASWLRVRSALQAGGNHARILGALASVSTLILLAKVIAAGKEMVIARQYGVGPVTDAYAYIFNLVSWPVATAMGMLTVVLLPLLIRQRQASPAENQIFRREFFGATILASLPIMIVVGVVWAMFLEWKLPGLADRARAVSLDIMPAMLLLVPLGLINAFLSVRLMAQFKHTNSLYEAAPALGIIVGIQVWPSGNALPLVLGMVGGTVLQCLLLAVGQDRDDPLQRPAFRRTSPAWNSAIRALAIVGLGQVLVSATNLVDQSMVAHLGVGSNAVLGYANRLLGLGLTLASTAITRALLPVLSDLSTAGFATLRRVTAQWVLIIFAATVVVTAISWLVAPYAVELIYQRGAFTATDTASVTYVLQLGLLQLPFFAGGIVVVQFLASQADYKIFLFIGMINLTVKTIANLIFIPHWGVGGVMLATAAMYVISTPTLWFLSIRRARSHAQ